MIFGSSIDLHTHTREVSSCSYLPVEELIAQVMALGLGGVAVTDHSRMGCAFRCAVPAELPGRLRPV